MKDEYLELKEVKTISLTEFDVDDDKFISAADMVNQLLRDGWILLKITDREYILGLKK